MQTTSYDQRRPEQSPAVLLVGDRADVLEEMRLILKDGGRNPAEAHSGQEALNALEGGEFAVIVLDLQMAEADGFEVAESIRGHARRRYTPIIFIASQYAGDSVARAYALAPADHLTRPVMPEVLRAKVDGFIQLFEQAERHQREQLHKRNAEALQFLADASRVLAELEDVPTTLDKVARLSVPRFADWCAVDMLAEDGSLRRLAVAHVDPAKVELARDMQRRYPPDPNAPQGVWSVLRSGQPELLSEITDEILVERIKDPQRLSAARRLGVKSYMGVPLQVRGETLGVITFASAESGRRYSSADLAVAQDLAHRAGVATENARLYAELRKADRLKDEFLAMLAHELRNPLSPICNALHIMKQPSATPAVVERVRAMAERQAQHMTRLLDDLMDVSRISRGLIELRKEIVDVVAVIRRCAEGVQPLIAERGHHLDLYLPVAGLWVDADPHRLEQVIANLLNNAAKYTNPGGRIEVSATQDDGNVLLSVRDTGIGIASDMLPRVFDLFVQAERPSDRSQGGVGIGLTLVKRLVEMHGGKVEATSPGLGRGSEFKVRLPAAAVGEMNAAGVPVSPDDLHASLRRPAVVK
jgi:signal transduction histidine kinase/DNA-binding response OmpR family regulator